MDNLYVYALMDGRKPGPFYYGNWKFSYEPFYIGRGKGDRSVSHVKAANKGRGTNKHKNNKILKIQRSGYEVVVRHVKTSLTNDLANYYECRLIKRIGRADLGLGPLVNLTDGGDGTVGYKVSRATRNKNRQAKLGKKMPEGFVEKRQATMNAKSRREKEEIREKKRVALSLTWTARKRKEQARKISLLKKGHTVSAETRAKISAALKGRPCTEERRQKLTGRVLSKETRTKISIALMGHTVSKETRRKISVGHYGKPKRSLRSSLSRT